MVLMKPDPDEGAEEFAQRFADAVQASANAKAPDKIWTVKEYRKDQSFGHFISKGRAGMSHDDSEFLLDRPGGEDRLATIAEFGEEVRVFLERVETLRSRYATWREAVNAARKALKKERG